MHQLEQLAELAQNILPEATSKTSNSMQSGAANDAADLERAGGLALE